MCTVPGVFDQLERPPPEPTARGDTKIRGKVPHGITAGGGVPSHAYPMGTLVWIVRDVMEIVIPADDVTGIEKRVAGLGHQNDAININVAERLEVPANVRAHRFKVVAIG